MFIHKYDDIIKSIRTDNKNLDSVIQSVKEEEVKLLEEVQADNQIRMQLYNCQRKELTKSKTFYKSLLDMEDDVRIYIYGSRDKDTNCRTRYLLSVSPENNLTPTTSLQLYHTDRELKDFINNRGYGSSSI